ncbi:MAG: hypothetical protein NZT61_05535 [Deltaproteobacteria bacterium]|nr:hypothetical protein [Deltaproteobacteria bacterium]
MSEDITVLAGKEDDFGTLITENLPDPVKIEYFTFFFGFDVVNVIDPSGLKILNITASPLKQKRAKRAINPNIFAFCIKDITLFGFRVFLIF